MSVKQIYQLMFKTLTTSSFNIPTKNFITISLFVVHDSIGFPYSMPFISIDGMSERKHNNSKKGLVTTNLMTFCVPKSCKK